MSLSGEDMGDDLVRLYAFVLVSSSLADMFHTISRLTHVGNLEIALTHVGNLEIVLTRVGNLKIA